MKKTLIVAAVAMATAVACGTTSNNNDAGTGGGTGTGGGAAVLDLSSGTKILAHLEGKTMVMQGADIPDSPLGFNQNLNFGINTQCYNKVKIDVLASNFAVTTNVGKFTPGGDGGVGQVGVCDTSTAVGTPLSYTSSAVLFQNVTDNGGCFDADMTYTGFAQEGRGKISPDGTTVTLELYASGRATNIRCANGPVGTIGADGGVKVLGATLLGNSKQVYRVQ